MILGVRRLMMNGTPRARARTQKEEEEEGRNVALCSSLLPAIACFVEKLATILGVKRLLGALGLAMMLAGWSVAACGDDESAGTPPPKPLAEAGPEDSSSPPQEGGGAASDAGTRSYYLSSTGTRVFPSGPEFGYRLTADNLAEDVDLFAIHQEFYGIPWDNFENGTPPPPEWASVMDRLAADAKAARKPGGQPTRNVFLSVSPVNGGRDGLANTTVIRNGVVENAGSGKPCFDFLAAPDGIKKKTAYVRYVEYLIDKFDPAYVAVVIEANLFAEKCPAAWPGLVDVSNAAYDAAKAKGQAKGGADIVAFPSFQIGHLYGYDQGSCPPPKTKDECYAAASAQLDGLRRDRFAISTYPYLDGLKVVDVPADWFTKGPSRKSERAVIAEVGWNSTPVVAQAYSGQCQTFLNDSEADSLNWLNRVLGAATASNMDLVTWVSNRDLVTTKFMADCPCTFDATWCGFRAFVRGDAGVVNGQDQALFTDLFLKAFGAMGVRTYEGEKKPALYPRWKAAKDATPIVAP
jgi:hypothetical protein